MNSLQDKLQFVVIKTVIAAVYILHITYFLCALYLQILTKISTKMVFIQRLHPMAIKPTNDRRVPETVSVDGIRIPFQLYVRGLSFECYKDITLGVNVQAAIETGWAISLKPYEFATINITNDFSTPVSLIEKYLPLGYEGELNAHILNTFYRPIDFRFATPLITICIFEIKKPTFTIVDDIMYPTEKAIVEADSTS